jgi:ABC-type phosphate transport system substrate-binding protein
VTRAATLVLAFGLALAAAAARGEDPGFRVVVNAANAVTSMTKEEAARYFLRKKAAWPDGSGVQPVDLAPGPTRRVFTSVVLKKDVFAVKSYWETQIFSGRGVPPPEKPSDAAVIAFVEANPGAIGYVSAAAPLGEGVREVKVR